MAEATGKEAATVISLPHNLHPVRRAHRDVSDLPLEQPSVSPLYPTLFIDSKFWTEVLAMFASSITAPACSSEPLSAATPLTRSNVHVADSIDYLHRQVFAKFIASSASPNGKGVRPAGIRQILHQIGVPCSSAMVNALVERMHYIALNVRSLIRERTETALSLPQAHVDTFLGCVSHAMARRLASDAAISSRNDDSVRSVDSKPSPVRHQCTPQLKVLSTPDFLSSRMKEELMLRKASSPSPRQGRLRTSSPLARAGSDCSPSANFGDTLLRYPNSPSSVVRSSVGNSSSIVPPTRASILRSDAGTRSAQRDVNGRARSPASIAGATRDKSPVQRSALRNSCHDVSSVTYRSSLASRESSPTPSQGSPSRQRTTSPRKGPIGVASPVAVGFNAEYHQKIVEEKFSHVHARVQHLCGTVFLHRQDENPLIPAPNNIVGRQANSPVRSQVVKSPTLHHYVLAKSCTDGRSGGSTVARSLHREMGTASLFSSSIHSLPSVPRRVADVPLPHSTKLECSATVDAATIANQLLRTDDEVRCYTKAPTDLIVTVVVEEPVYEEHVLEEAPAPPDCGFDEQAPRHERLTRTDDDVRLHSAETCSVTSPCAPANDGVENPSQTAEAIAIEAELLWRCRPVERGGAVDSEEDGMPSHVPNLAEEW